jgi:hypothetical protein
MHPGARAFLLCLLAPAAPALTQTLPLQTEEATTAPAGRILFETAVDGIANEPNYVTTRPRTFWSGPLLRLVYSPADMVELDLEWVTRVWATGEAGAPDVSDWGDVTLRAKVRFHDGEAKGPTLGARFGVTLAETSFNDSNGQALGLGPNTLRVFVEGLLTQPLGRAQIHVNLGFFNQDEVLRPHEQRDFLSYGFAFTWRTSPTFELVSELAGRAGKGQPGVEARSEARVGARVGQGRVRGDFAVRRGLAQADGTWGGIAGLTWRMKGPSALATP